MSKARNDQGTENQNGQESETPSETATSEASVKILRLARVKVAKPVPADAPLGTKPQVEVVYKRPPTVDGEVRIYGLDPIHLPSLADQESGFAPLFLRENKETKKLEPDAGSGEEAARVLLEQYPSVYVRFVEKGE